MRLPFIGAVTNDERFDWRYSVPMLLWVFAHQEVRIVLEATKRMRKIDDFRAAISTFTSIDAAVLSVAEPHVFGHYQDMNGYWQCALEKQCEPFPLRVTSGRSDRLATAGNRYKHSPIPS